MDFCPSPGATTLASFYFLVDGVSVMSVASADGALNFDNESCGNSQYSESYTIISNG